MSPAGGRWGAPRGEVAGRCGPRKKPRRAGAEAPQRTAVVDDQVRAVALAVVRRPRARAQRALPVLLRARGGRLGPMWQQQARYRHLPPSPFPHAPRASRPSTQRRRRSWRRPRRPRRGPAWRRCCSCGRRAGGRMRGGRLKKTRRRATRAAHAARRAAGGDAPAPADVAAQRLERLDEHGRLDGHVQRACRREREGGGGTRASSGARTHFAQAAARARNRRRAHAPAMRAPLSAPAYSVRHDIRPGISTSARSSSCRERERDGNGSGREGEGARLPQRAKGNSGIFFLAESHLAAKVRQRDVSHLEVALHLAFFC